MSESASQEQVCHSDSSGIQRNRPHVLAIRHSAAGAVNVRNMINWTAFLMLSNLPIELPTPSPLESPRS